MPYKMDLEVHIKEEPVCLEAAENYELALEVTHLKEESESELTESGQRQPSAVKDEIVIDEHTVGQQVPCLNEENTVENVRVLIKSPSGKTPYHCTECGKTFCRRDKLSRHMFTHSRERPYHCTICSKAFRRRDKLRRHMIIHSARSHLCLVCDKSFSLSDDLRRHMLIHTGQRPHTCTKCGRTFSQSGSMKRHMLTHSGVKP